MKLPPHIPAVFLPTSNRPCPSLACLAPTAAPNQPASSELPSTRPCSTSSLNPSGWVISGTPLPDCQLYAPSLPNSFVHSAFLVRSSPETVGLDDLTDLTKSLKSTMGSSSSSVLTASHVISMASGSPGEQGVTLRTPSAMTYH